MARRVFFSFHYQRDVWRVNQIRNIPNIIQTAAAGFSDASLWEEAKAKGEQTIKNMIDRALQNTSVTVVFIGAQTAGRKYINYEIDQSIARGNGLLGMQIHGLKDQNGRTDDVGNVPSKLSAGGYKIFNYFDHDKLSQRIEEAARAAGR